MEYNISNLDPYMVRAILLNSDYDTILEYCRTYRNAQSICYDNVFWRGKAFQDFHISSNEFNNSDFTGAQRYLELLTKGERIMKGSEKYIGVNHFAAKALQDNRIDLFNYILKEYPNYRWDWYNFTKNINDIDTFEYIRFVAPKDFTWNLIELAKSSLKYGNKTLFIFATNMIPLDILNDYWNTFAEIALYNLELFEYVKSIAPENVEWYWNDLLMSASKNKEFFDYIKSIAPNDIEWDWDGILSSASKSGDKDLFDYIRSIAPNDVEWDWNDLLIRSSESGNIILFEYIRSIAPNDIEWFYRGLARGAIVGLSNAPSEIKREMLDHIISLAPTNYEWTWTYMAQEALLKNDRYLFEHIVQLEKKDLDWDFLITTAIQTADEDNFDYLMPLVPKNYIFDFYIIDYIMILESIGSFDLLIKFASLIGPRQANNFYWTGLAKYAIKRGQINILNHIVSLAPPKEHKNIIGLLPPNSSPIRIIDYVNFPYEQLTFNQLLDETKLNKLLIKHHDRKEDIIYKLKQYFILNGSTSHTHVFLSLSHQP